MSSTGWVHRSSIEKNEARPRVREQKIDCTCHEMEFVLRSVCVKQKSKQMKKKKVSLPTLFASHARTVGLEYPCF